MLDSFWTVCKHSCLHTGHLSFNAFMIWLAVLNLTCDPPPPHMFLIWSTFNSLLQLQAKDRCCSVSSESTAAFMSYCECTDGLCLWLVFSSSSSWIDMINASKQHDRQQSRGAHTFSCQRPERHGMRIKSLNFTDTKRWNDEMGGPAENIKQRKRFQLEQNQIWPIIVTVWEMD